MLSAFLTLIDGESDKIKFEKIYYKYSATMHNVAFKQVKDYHIAQDAVQEALMRIAKVINRFDDIDSQDAKGLICVITKYAAVYAYNKLNPNNFMSLESHCKTVGVCDDNSADYIYDALQKLDVKYSSVLVLKLKYELTDKEIAEIVDLPFNTVRTRIQRGRILLRKILEKV